jgi:hypothetical protein
LVDFNKIVLEEEVFAVALYNLGILANEDFVNNDYDEDLDREMSKKDIQKDDDFLDKKKGEFVAEPTAVTNAGIFEVENVGAGE